MAATTASRAPRHRFVVEIDAGQAFGTAHHASTRGCLLALDHLLKRSRPRIVLDLGTGTGLLAIAASQALKRRVLASDNDPVAVATAKANAGPELRGRTGDGGAGSGLRPSPASPPQGCDLIFANLLDRTLRELACELGRHTGEWRRGGAFGHHLRSGGRGRGRLPSARLYPGKANRSRWMDDAGDAASEGGQSARLTARPEGAIDRQRALSLQRPAMYQIFDEVEFPGRERRTGERVAAGAEIAKAEGLSRSP